MSKLDKYFDQEFDLPDDVLEAAETKAQAAADKTDPVFLDDDTECDGCKI